MTDNSQYPTTRQDTYPNSTDQEGAMKLPDRRIPDPIKSQISQGMGMIGAGSSPMSSLAQSSRIAAKPLAPTTVTEALEDLMQRQSELKAALDVLISDATTLRAQM